MIVLDTSSLSALTKIKRLDLLELFSDDIVIPASVEREILKSDTAKGIDWKLVRVTELNKREEKRSSRLRRDYNLGEGESAVLALCEHNNYSAVIDERASAKIADVLGIKYTGTLNIIRKSYQKDIIKTKSELKRILRDLEEKDNFYLSDELYEWVMKAEKKD